MAALSLEEEETHGDFHGCHSHRPVLQYTLQRPPVMSFEPHGSFLSAEGPAQRNGDSKGQGGRCDARKVHRE